MATKTCGDCPWWDRSERRCKTRWFESRPASSLECKERRAFRVLRDAYREMDYQKFASGIYASQQEVAVKELWDALEIRNNEIDKLRSELARVKGEVPCSICCGVGGDGIKSEHRHPCYEDPQTGVPRCELFAKKDCLHKEDGYGWATCSSGGKSEYIFRPCPTCQGTGKKYPEES